MPPLALMHHRPEHQEGIEVTEPNNPPESAGTQPAGATEPPGPDSALTDTALSDSALLNTPPAYEDTTTSFDAREDAEVGLNGPSSSNGHHPVEAAASAEPEPVPTAPVPTAPVPTASVPTEPVPTEPAPAEGEADGSGVLAGARQRVGPAVATVRDKVSPAVAKVGPAVSTAKDKVGPAVSTAKDKVGPAVSTAKNKVAPAVSTAKEKVGPAVSTAKEKVGPAVASAREKVSPQVAAAADRVRSQAGEHPWLATAAERAAAVASSGKTAREFGQEIRRHPAVAGGAGAALAAALGAAWLRLRSRRSSGD
jgi:hypothetical protein